MDIAFGKINWHYETLPDNTKKALENIIGRLKVQYPSVAHNYHHISRSICSNK